MCNLISTENQIVYVKELVKKFGNFEALRGISFYVKEGEIFGLIGPNGAGKTTTFRILSTLLLPTSGIVKIDGKDVVKESDKVRRIISYLPEDAGTYRNITGYEYLKMVSEIYFRNKRDAEEALELGIKLADLGNQINEKMKNYSKGMKRRIQVVRSLIVKPKVAILDEPTAGLDVMFASYIRKTIKDFVKSNKVTILISSHNMHETEELCDRVALINEGKILAEGYTNELIKSYGANDLEDLFMILVKGEQK